MIPLDAFTAPPTNTQHHTPHAKSEDGNLHFSSESGNGGAPFFSTILRHDDPVPDGAWA